jgi:hypothetical protein
MGYGWQWRRGGLLLYLLPPVWQVGEVDCCRFCTQDSIPPLSGNSLFLHLPLTRSKLDRGRWINPHYTRRTMKMPALNENVGALWKCHRFMKMPALKKNVGNLGKCQRYRKMSVLYENVSALWKHKSFMRLAKFFMVAKFASNVGDPNVIFRGLG